MAQRQRAQPARRRACVPSAAPEPSALHSQLPKVSSMARGSLVVPEVCTTIAVALRSCGRGRSGGPSPQRRVDDPRRAGERRVGQCAGRPARRPPRRPGTRATPRRTRAPAAARSRRARPVARRAPRRRAARARRSSAYVSAPSARACGRLRAARGSQGSTSIGAQSSVPAHDGSGLDARGRVRGHPLRAQRRRDREDHDRPPGGAQRVPAADRDRADARVRGGARGRIRRRDHPHRRGAAGVLLGRRPARARRPRLRGAARQRRRALPRDRPARADAPPAQADRRDGRRLRRRRRPRAASSCAT